MLELTLAHLAAAALSAIAWMEEREALVFLTVRAAMPPLGFYTAWHSWWANGPAWMSLGLALMGTMFLPFFTPGRAGWAILNPQVSLAFLAHLGWIAVTT